MKTLAHALLRGGIKSTEIVELVFPLALTVISSGGDLANQITLRFPRNTTTDKNQIRVGAFQAFPSPTINYDFYNWITADSASPVLDDYRYRTDIISSSPTAVSVTGDGLGGWFDFSSLRTITVQRTPSMPAGGQRVIRIRFAHVSDLDTVLRTCHVSCNV